jgi:hypothetical protein
MAIGAALAASDRRYWAAKTVRAAPAAGSAEQAA